MKYKIGDKVRIKSLDWYNENKNKCGTIYTSNGFCFCDDMAKYCGDIMKIIDIIVDPKDSNQGYYIMDNVKKWTDEMIEGLVEEKIIDLTSIVMETVEEKTIQNTLTYGYNLPEGYIFKDENDNVINATKIVLEKKKKEYPKTYVECSDILSVYTDPDISGYKGELLWAFQKLLVCRGAYWKIAGDEMGLGKPWEPTMETVYCISRNNNVMKCSYRGGKSNILEFPTEEMRDAFYEAFKELIEECKELL